MNTMQSIIVLISVFFYGYLFGSTKTYLKRFREGVELGKRVAKLEREFEDEQLN